MTTVPRGEGEAWWQGCLVGSRMGTSSHTPSPGGLVGEGFSLPEAPGEGNRGSSDSSVAAGLDLTSGQPTHRERPLHFAEASPARQLSEFMGLTPEAKLLMSFCWKDCESQAATPFPE